MSDRKGRIHPIACIDVYSVEELRELQAAGLQRTDTLSKAIDKAEKDHMPRGVVAIESEALGLWRGQNDWPGLSSRLEEQIHAFEPHYTEPRTRDERQIDWTKQGGAVAGEKASTLAAAVVHEAFKEFGMDVPIEWIEKWAPADRRAAWEWLQARAAAAAAGEQAPEPPFIVRGLLSHQNGNAPVAALNAGDTGEVAEADYQVIDYGAAPSETEKAAFDRHAAVDELRTDLVHHLIDVPLAWLLRRSDDEISELFAYAEAIAAGEVEPARPRCFDELQVIRTDRKTKVKVYAEAPELEAAAAETA